MPLYERVPNQKEVSDKTLKDAIETSFSECWFSMMYLNVLVGQQTAKWDLIHDYKIEEILEEAKIRGLPVEEWHCAIPSDELIVESKRYKKIMARE